MSDNFLTKFPKTPELHPTHSLQATIWQIVGIIFIAGGLLVMAWGGWMFYQEQAELYNPPAPIVDSIALENLDTTNSSPSPVNSIPATTSPQKTTPPPVVELAALPAIPPPAPPDKASQPPILADEIDPKPVRAVASTVPAPTPSTDEAASTESVTPITEPLTETVPSLADNPLVVVEDKPDQSLSAPSQAAGAATSPPTRIVAESIGLDAPVVETGWKTIVQDGVATNVWVVADYAAGWHKDSMLPGQGGNIVLSGHHNIKGEVFRYIVDLKVGDTVGLYVGDQRYDYVVNDKFIVKDKGEPDSVRQANARWIGPFNEERLTLVTCWPYNNNTHRVIVIAKPLQNSGQ